MAATRKKTTHKKTAKKKTASRQTTEFESQEGRLIHVPLDRLHPDPDQPRRHFDEQGLADLAADIEQRDILQSLLVRDYVTGHGTKPGHYIIGIGERRWRAAKMVGLETVPCIVDNSANDAPLDRLLAQVSENVSRADLNPIELAHFFDQLINIHGYTTGQIPQLLEERGLQSISRSYVSNHMRLIKLPQWAQDYIIGGELTARHGRALLPALQSKAVMKKLKSAIDDEMNFAEQRGESITSDEVEETVERLFQNEHICLDTKYGDKAVLYGWDEKTDAEALGIVKVGDMQFATNTQEHQLRQKAAKEKIAEKEKKRQEQQAKKAAKQTGQNTKAEKEIRRPPDHKISTYLFGIVGSESTPNGGWLRRHIIDIIGTLDPNKVDDRDDIRYRLFVWCALQCPEVGGGAFFGFPAGTRTDLPIDNDSAVTGKTRVAEQHHIGNILSVISETYALADLILNQARHAIIRMHDHSLALLAAHLEVNLDAAWRADEDYLALYTGPALDEMAQNHLPPSPADDIRTAKVGEKRQLLLDHKEAIGVTDDIRRIWDEALDDAKREVDAQREAIEKLNAETKEAAE